MLDLVKSLELGLDKMESEEWDNSKIHVSDLAVALEGDDGKCARQLWLRLKGSDKRPYTAGQKLMFQQGNNLHEMIAQLLEDTLNNSETIPWTVVAIEEPVSIQGITGRLDIRIVNELGKNLITDFKTLRGNAFNYLNGPKESNELQVQTYMMAKNAELGSIVYADREGQNFARQFEVERDDLAVQKAIDKTKKLMNKPVPPERMKPKIYLKENKTMTTIYILEPWNCSYCQYKGISCDGCFGDLASLYEDNKNKDGKLLVGHKKKGKIEMKKGYEKLEPIVKECI